MCINLWGESHRHLLWEVFSLLGTVTTSKFKTPFFLQTTLGKTCVNKCLTSNSKTPSNTYLSLNLIGFSWLQNVKRKNITFQLKEMKSIIFKINAKQNTSFIYLPGAPGSSFVLLLHFCTNTINEQVINCPILSTHIACLNANVNFTHEVLFPHNNIP